MKVMWRHIYGTGLNFSVSNDGRVLDNRSGIERNIHQWGNYLSVSVPINGAWVTFLVHRLVAKHFIPNPENKPEVNHVDGNKDNNKADNLRWCTKSENERHAWDTGLKKSRINKSVGKIVCKKIGRYSMTGELLKEYVSVNDAVRDGYNYACIIETVYNRNGRTQHKGFKWAFMNQPNLITN